jgi:hypothetical protein
MAAGGRGWPKDPNFWLLAGLCCFGLLSLVGLLLTLLGAVSPESWLQVALYLVLPGAGFALVLSLQYGSQGVRFHPAMLIGCLIIVALSLLVYLHLIGVL